MKKLFAALLVLASASVFAQSYPSPTYNNLTVQGTVTLTNHPLAVSSGGTGAASASGTTLDNITGFSGTGFLTRTGAGAYAFQSLTNGITYANLAQAAANTVLGNATGATANVAALAVPNCSTSSSALNWTSASGFSCNTAINASTLGGTAAASYALLASPTFTGTPAAPTAALATNTTQIATTAFVIANAGTGRLLNVQVFTSSGTYTPTTGTNSAIIYGTGAGGGGGGCAATSASQVAIAGAGTAGSWGVARIISPTSQTVTIGAAGTGGTAGANAGTAGGQTSIGTYLVAPGGGGGPAGSATTLTNAMIYGSPAIPGAAPTSSGTLLYGATGQWGIPGFSTYNTPNGFASTGGSGPFGTGTQGGINAVVNASGYGSGAGGCYGYASGAATAGGTGRPGLVIVYEYN
ncbi:hypothetical protein C7399_109193 [Paraburkholderia tropica]|uniref:Phage tail protein n=1 Tax=Paraburkholderia tropica TaxID=92647 RepID=A0ABX5MQ99_9BURK|nr:hypothetical protein [Paraburkholderia tropica]PXX15858.1 hypothetical protein C7400_109193 [Paraburkholderia tropica]PZW82117.1 hypothetical protein C7399_109193 [Paraburkholderia tropica]